MIGSLSGILGERPGFNFVPNFLLDSAYAETTKLLQSLQSLIDSIDEHLKKIYSKKIWITEGEKFVTNSKIIKVEKDEMVIPTKDLEPNKFYLVEFGDEKLAVRKIDENRVEIYEIIE